MIRPFTHDDLVKFPQVKILSRTMPDQTKKDYLYIERPPFISALVIIDQYYSIFVEQYRPVIDQITVEIPMGKVDSTDETPLHALKRELWEECSLNIDEKTLLLTKNNSTETPFSFTFQDIKIHKLKTNFVSPGFSNSTQIPFIIEITSENNSFSEYATHYQLVSQEPDLRCFLLPINHDIFNIVQGLSRYMIFEYLQKGY